MRILIAVENGIDYFAFGPFESVHDAQVFAREFRELNNIPGHDTVETTPEQNDAWTEAGWYFGIHTVSSPALPYEPSEPGVPGNDDDRHDLSDEERQRDIGQAAWPLHDVDDMAAEIAALTDDTREIVMDALRVRAMDFVQDRLHRNDAAADLAADIYRIVDPGADGNNAFDPDTYTHDGPLPANVLLIEQLKLQRESVWQQLQERNGASVELAEQIETLDDQIARLESGENPVNPDQEALA